MGIVFMAGYVTRLVAFLARFAAARWILSSSVRQRVRLGFPAGISRSHRVRLATDCTASGTAEGLRDARLDKANVAVSNLGFNRVM